MAREKKTNTSVSPELLLEQAIIPIWEQPYKTPYNWMWVKQGSISTFLNGRAYKQTELLKDDTLTPVLRVGNLFTNGSWYYSNLNLEENKYIDHDDLIYAWSASFGPFIWQGDKVIYHYHIWKILVSEVLDKKYYYYWLMYDTERLKRGGHGIGMLHITKEMMENAAMPLPPLTEQNRIVNRVESMFAKLDETKENAQSVLEGFETRKAAILHKAFSGELTIKWRTEHMGAEWDKKTLGELFKVSSGKALTAKNMTPNGTVPVYGGNGITGYHDKSNVEAETVVIGRVGFYCGSIHYIREPAWVTDNALIVSLKTQINKHYMVYLLRYTDLRQNESSAAQPVISGSKIYPIEVQIASLEEQLEIVRVLDNLLAKEQQAKEAAEAVLEKIELLKKSILARAFRGELGTNDPTEESAVELLKQVLQEDAPAVPQKRSKSIPKELQGKLATELERKIVKLYFKQETDSLPAEELLSVSSKKFEVMGALHNLEQAGILKRLPNGNYRLLE